jgi:hypothetical protein
MDHEYLTEVKITVTNYNPVTPGGPPKGEREARVPIPGQTQQRAPRRMPIKASVKVTTNQPKQPLATKKEKKTQHKEGGKEPFPAETRTREGRRRPARGREAPKLAGVAMADVREGVSLLHFRRRPTCRCPRERQAGGSPLR